MLKQLGILTLDPNLLQGLVKTIGVSNFSIAKLKNLLSKCTIRPAVNQVIRMATLIFFGSGQPTGQDLIDGGLGELLSLESQPSHET